MGCHVDMLQECKVDEDVKSRISVYNQALDKMQRIPKLRKAIFNPIVQRRKMQKQEED
ncbi:unnamed protein product [Paramecium sonneborni]|uniref:Uncharacterized protein n=1 Tax=Paramecium sonneborni TaxID=65129 RepID=A0A8S1RAA9_9CILI|nr:unnamed protein product [Paramecium sonneborni]